MPAKCYTTDEILQLRETDEHLLACPRCRALYERKLQLDGLLPQEWEFLSRLREQQQQRDRAKALITALEPLSPRERYALLAVERDLTPETVLVLCAHAKEFHFRSPNQAEEWLLLAEQVAQALANRPDGYPAREVSWALGKLFLAQSNLAMSRGLVRACHRYVTKAYALFKQLGDVFQQALAARGLLFSLSKMGQARKAIITALDALATLRSYGATHERYWLWNNLSLVLLAGGNLARAEKVNSLLLQRVSPEHENYPILLHNRILILVARHAGVLALQELAFLCELVRKQGLEIEEGRTHILEGEVHLLQERPGEALVALATARRLLQSEQAHYDLALIAVYEARAYTMQGESAASVERLQTAITFFSKEGFSGDLVHALLVWEKAHLKAENESRLASNDAFDTFRNLWYRPLPENPRT